MSERPHAAEDVRTISRRLSELAAERRAILACTCEAEIGTAGEVRRILPLAGCPAHGGALCWEGCLPD